jgi:hypothetical protein
MWWVVPAVPILCCEMTNVYSLKLHPWRIRCRHVAN